MRRVGPLAAASILCLVLGTPARGATPSRYSLANRCWTIGSARTGGHLAIAGPDAYRAGARATPFYLRPTGLGTYLIADPAGDLLVTGSGEQTARAATAAAPAEWRARRSGAAMTLQATSSGRLLSVAAGGALVTAPPGRPAASQRFTFSEAHGCRAYPEAQVDASGRPFRAGGRHGPLFGFADAHVHIAADLRAGGSVIYGETYDRFGIAQALGHDADVHGSDGSLDITGNLLRNGSPTGTHDTHGWPSFTGWPTYDTYTHQQVYYRWLQRAWMAGMRLAVAQLIEDEPLCNIEPTHSHSCDETATVQLEVARLRGLQDYIDAQAGGPGRGWLRLVYDPGQARRAIRRGQLAVILGVEASDPFGCSERDGEPQCDRAAIDRGLVLYQHLGIRAMFVTHWVDNAFGGAALEGGSKGTLIGTMNVEQTGNPFMTGACPEAGEGEEVAPLPGKQCNTRGLTDLGRYLIGRMMDDHMLIEADHLDEPTRLAVFALAEARHYPLISSHNNTGGFWTPSQLRRLHALGGYVSATLDEPAALAAKIVALKGYGFPGVGLGTDTGGFNALPGPDKTLTLRYPFRSYDGAVRFARQRTGTRTFDINRDGMAHYGLMPDLLALVRHAPHGAAALRALFGSAAAYVQTWQRAVTH